MSNSGPGESDARRLWAAAIGPGRSRPGPCPPLAELAAYVDGRLTSDEQEAIERHLADCPDCLGAVVDARLHAGADAAVAAPCVIEAARTIVAPPVLATIDRVRERRRPRTQWPFLWRLPLAAAASIAIGLLGYQAGSHASMADGTTRVVSEMTFGLLADEHASEWEMGLVALDLEGGSP